MRLVLVNHCAPGCPHVCAVRLRSFAAALAELGHQVVLLTEALAGEAGDTPDGLDARLAGHHWSVPLFLATRPRAGSLAARARAGRLPSGLRQAVIAGTYLWRGGLFGDWSDAARPLAEALGRGFRPDAVWASFGNSDCWLLGRWVARAAGCPWVGDVKDPLTVFLPAAVRSAVLARFRDAAAFTALSAGHAADVRAVTGRSVTVVHSGIGREFLPPPPPPPVDGPLRLFLMGALYGQGEFRALVEGVRLFVATSPRRVVLAYAGTERERFAALTTGLDTESHPFLSLDRLRTEMARAHALLYVRNPRALFQHKLFELAAMGRPILCLPDEDEEAHALARCLGVSLIGCADGTEMAMALSTLPPPTPANGLADFTWEAQARVLLRLLGTLT